PHDHRDRPPPGDGGLGRPRRAARQRPYRGRGDPHRAPRHQRAVPRAAGPTGGGRGAGPMMAWGSGAVRDEEKLSSTQARQVVRRSLRMLRPYRRQVTVALVVLVVYTLAMLAGPLMVRLGIDRGLQAHDALVLNLAVVGYLVAAAVAVVLGRTQITLITRVGESFLRDLREP